MQTRNTLLHERILLLEDDLYEFDVLTELLLTIIHKLELILSEVSSPNIHSLDPNDSLVTTRRTYLRPHERSTLQRLYNENGQVMLKLLDCKPSATIMAILPRLKQKLKKWRHSRLFFSISQYKLSVNQWIRSLKLSKQEDKRDRFENSFSSSFLIHQLKNAALYQDCQSYDAEKFAYQSRFFDRSLDSRRTKFESLVNETSESLYLPKFLSSFGPDSDENNINNINNNNVSIIIKEKKTKFVLTLNVCQNNKINSRFLIGLLPRIFLRDCSTTATATTVKSNNSNKINGSKKICAEEQIDFLRFSDPERFKNKSVRVKDAKKLVEFVGDFAKRFLFVESGGNFEFADATANNNNNNNTNDNIKTNNIISNITNGNCTIQEIHYFICNREWYLLIRRYLILVKLLEKSVDLLTGVNTSGNNENEESVEEEWEIFVSAILNVINRGREERNCNTIEEEEEKGGNLKHFLSICEDEIQYPKAALLPSLLVDFLNNVSNVMDSKESMEYYTLFEKNIGRPLREYVEESFFVGREKSLICMESRRGDMKLKIGFLARKNVVDEILDRMEPVISGVKPFDTAELIGNGNVINGMDKKENPFGSDVKVIIPAKAKDGLNENGNNGVQNNYNNSDNKGFRNPFLSTTPED